MPAFLGTLRTGTSGIVVPGPKATFPEAYQSTSRLTYYATLFNSVEINSTFYRIPQPKTFAAWAAETGPEFDFTIKLWRDITHTTALADNLSGIVRFMDAARELGPKKGCLLIQFPPSNTIRQLNAVSALLTALAAADPAHEWRKAVEFRHPSWYTDDTFDMLDQHGASLVLHDKGPARNAQLNEGQTLSICASTALRATTESPTSATFCMTRLSRYTTTSRMGKTCMPTSTIPWAPLLKMPKTCTGW
ncbi:DUF72 domain-containing protein [Hymenobacter cellulosilyticus]|uniref:DUF72 domain-containing protein n=1 Tax=Hymenobacter cellulosilyticus TaxID=2932248 RepID=A0A8T9Q9D7_9BACT|nr:DUF72 domain-containing protein [Hymenobacter cellulosilyticus]UOQ72738.1 DUF72 domain-containing protein [Hymenobacter cellulosilyticus]